MESKNKGIIEPLNSFDVAGVTKNKQKDRIVNGANDAFADDALNKLDHEAQGILCTFADDSKLVESALHAGSLHSNSEKA
ncbi:hypothetical protein TURU_017463 [Turdus rufiventris]|nr:hypothetical protein TURU_017463 [Turdus rufiventris]